MGGVKNGGLTLVYTEQSTGVERELWGLTNLDMGWCFSSIDCAKGFKKPSSVILVSFLTFRGKNGAPSFEADI